MPDQVAAADRALAAARALATLAVVFLLDQVSKAIVVANLERGEDVNIFLGIDLTNVRNTGVAFGALTGGGTALVAGIAVALGGLLVFFALNMTRRLLWLPTGVLLGGALGNLADRAREGAVIDFIDPIAWPAFNLADVAIVIGVLMLLYVIEEPRRAKE